MEKYYTPTVDEFHVGFEYEVKYDFDRDKNDIDLFSGKHKLKVIESNKWEERVFSEFDTVNPCTWEHTLINYSHMIDDFSESLIRVKYLDKEDIESLGFKHIGNAVDIWYAIEGRFEIGSWTSRRIQIHYGREDNRMYISAEDPPDDHKIFEGIIKNKSELIKLMKQLNIL